MKRKKDTAVVLMCTNKTVSRILKRSFPQSFVIRYWNSSYIWKFIYELL